MQPFGVSFTEKTKRSVEFRWTDPNQNPLGWDVEIVKKGSSPTGIPNNVLPVQNRMYKAENLIPSTFYEIYIRSVCTGQNRSAWNGPFLVSTALENPTACPVSLDMKDNGTETFVIEVEEDGMLGQSVFISSVDIIAQHEWPADLRITLINPFGKSIVLTDYHGTGGVNFGFPGDPLCFQSTHFSDQACESIKNHKPPFNGTYTPVQPLFNLHDNTPARGTWRLVLHDRAAFHRGILTYFHINLSRENCQLPEDFFLTSINSNSVRTEWTPSSQCQTIKITIKEKGKPDDEEIVYFLNCLDRSFTIPNLNPETEYEIFYQSVCGFTLSQPSCKETFRTNCKAVSLASSFDNIPVCVESCQIPCPIPGTWQNNPDNRQDWIVWRNKTDTQDTGPESDISGSGEYIYIESQPSICGTDPILLQSTCLDIHSNPDRCDFSFYYHMYGEGIGTLHVQISTDNGKTWETLWSKSGNQGNSWQRAYISLENYHESIAIIRFLASPLNSIYGDIALDQIEFYGTVPTNSLFRYYRDEDGDSFGNSNTFTELCQSFPPEGYVENPDDCDDNNDKIHPASIEKPCNLIDENCNGMADDQKPDFDLFYQISVIHESCKGKKNGRIDLTLEGGQPPYQVRWNTGVETEDLIQIGAGIYYCTISDSTGCAIKSEFITVQAIESIQVLVTGLTPPTCPGVNNGAIIINHAGGQAPFNYTWSSGQTTKDIQQAEEGNYNLTITDINGCQAITPNISLQALPGISAGAINLTHPTCHDAENGHIKLGVLNGVAPYEFRWQNGIQSDELSQIGSGRYSCTVTDSRGCFTVFETTLRAPEKLEPLLISTEPVRCHGERNGIIKTTTLGGVPPYLYFWNHSAFEDDLFSLGAGIYTMTVTDRNGCKAVLDNVEVMQPDLLTGSVDTVTTARCLLGKNGTIELLAGGGSPPYHYSWNSSIFQDTSILTGLVTGVYSAIVYDSRGCKFNMGSIVVPYENIPVQVESTVLKDNICFGQAFGEITANVITGLAPYDFNWSNGQQYIKNSSLDTIIGLPTGSYAVTITDSEGCVGMSTPIILPFIPEITYQVSQITANTCKTDSSGAIRLSVQNTRGQAMVNWNSGPSGLFINSLTNGLYQAIITDSVGCAIQTELIRVTSLSDLSWDVKIEHSRPGLAEGQICISVKGALGSYVISWDEKIKDYTGTCAANIEAGTYVITITDEADCVDYITVIIEEHVQTNDPGINSCGFFPNPTHGTFDAHPDCIPYGISIFNTNGQLLFYKKPGDPVNFPDMNEKPAGIYIIKTDLPGRSIFDKIIKI